MLNTKIMGVVAVAALFMVPTVAVAEDGAPSVSYSAKKQGRVVFEKKVDQTVSAAQTQTDDFNPADIEPAAGDFEASSVGDKDSLAKSLQLPRK